MSKFLLALFCVLFQIGLFAEKVLIITSAYNRPDFVEIQHKTFQKFLQDDYEFVVFNDARDSKLSRSIAKTCKTLGVKCVKIPQGIHDKPYLERFQGENFHAPAVRNANVVQYALNNLGFAHNGIVAIFDSDLFLVKDFSIESFLDGYAIAGVPQVHLQNGIEIPYLWIGIAFLDMRKLPERNLINFNCGKIKGVAVDAGGYTYHYLTRHPEIKPKLFSMLHSSNFQCSECKKKGEQFCCTHNRKLLEELNFDENQIDLLLSGLQNVEFALDGTLLHYRGGSNWDHQSQGFHNKKTQLFTKYLSKILAD